MSLSMKVFALGFAVAAAKRVSLRLDGAGSGSEMHVNVAPSAADRSSLLPPDTVELGQLCDVIGLQRACPAFSSYWRIPNGEETPAEQQLAAQRAADNLKSLKEPIECLPAGRLVFVHVMKTGGLSIDSFLQRSCELHPEAACSIQRHDGWIGVEGRVKCDSPSICASHKPMETDVEMCGSSFNNASYFTVLREPVSRVWSFYNYISRWYKPYQQLTLKEVYEAADNGTDLNAGLPKEEQCFHCVGQLSDAMVSLSFAGDEDLTLDAAKAHLDKLKAIMDIEALDRFPEIAQEVELFPELFESALSSKTGRLLTMTHENTVEPRWGHFPDKETAKLIRAHNMKDIHLYEYARTLPTFHQ